VHPQTRTAVLSPFSCFLLERRRGEWSGVNGLPHQRVQRAAVARRHHHHHHNHHLQRQKKSRTARCIHEKKESLLSNAVATNACLLGRYPRVASLHYQEE
jgi:hypothetical protein